MKKLFTLLFIMGIAGIATAQNGRTDKTVTPVRKGSKVVVIADHNHYEKGYVFTLQERNRAIAKVNRKYERDIRQEKNKLFRGRIAKQRSIYQLERQRDAEIGRINAKFYSRSNNFNRKNFDKRGRF